MGKVDGCYYVINSTGGFAPEGTVRPLPSESAALLSTISPSANAVGVSWLDSLQRAKKIGTPA